MEKWLFIVNCRNVSFIVIRLKHAGRRLKKLESDVRRESHRRRKNFFEHMNGKIMLLLRNNVDCNVFPVYYCSNGNKINKIYTFLLM